MRHGKRRYGVSIHLTNGESERVDTGKDLSLTSFADSFGEDTTGSTDTVGGLYNLQLISIPTDMQARQFMIFVVNISHNVYCFAISGAIFVGRESFFLKKNRRI